MKSTLTYTGNEYGSGSLLLRDGAVNYQVTHNFFSDALGDLLNATASVLDGAACVKTTWFDDQTEYRWTLENNKTELSIKIIAVGKLFSRTSDEHGALEYQGK